MAEEQCCIVPEGPVVVEWVDGGSQRLQDAVHDTGDQAAYVWAQVQVGILDQALHHVEKPVELLQIMAYWLDLDRHSHTIGLMEKHKPQDHFHLQIILFQVKICKLKT